MPRKSRATIEDLEIIAMAKAIAFDVSKPDYIRTKALGTYNAMRQRMERQKAEKAAAAAARRDQREASQPKPWMNVLPNNNRGPVSHAPVAVKASWLMQPGETPAQYAQRREREG